MTEGIFNAIQFELKCNNAGMKRCPTVHLLQCTAFSDDNELIVDEAFDLCTQLGWGHKVPIFALESFESCELSPHPRGLR